MLSVVLWGIIAAQQVYGSGVRAKTDFLAIGGGQSKESTEIALEKNMRYFQRTLKVLGYAPSQMTYLFASGRSGEVSVRYLDRQGQERFKVAEVPYLAGGATWANIRAWFQQRNDRSNPLFVYFTGHGLKNRANPDNNTFTVWQESPVSVQQFARQLDGMTGRPPVTVMMAQCYGGSFANIIYQDGNPNNPVAAQERCGFFGTTRERVSVGCTPEVDEADYRDYSSSFWAGLSGRDRLGRPVPSADFNGDGRVSYAEAHAFAKVDNATTDVPVSTSEIWLQRQADATLRQQVRQQPIQKYLLMANPSQKYSLQGLVKFLGWNPQLSFAANSRTSSFSDEQKQAFVMRLELELVNIANSQKLKANPILTRLQSCEERSP
jgi:hypothetical protein